MGAGQLALCRYAKRLDCNTDVKRGQATNDGNASIAETVASRKLGRGTAPFTLSEALSWFVAVHVAPSQGSKPLARSSSAHEVRKDNLINRNKNH